jgi:hypothetical protein
MPADPTLDANLLRSLDSLCRGAGPAGISTIHLTQASAEDSAQVVRHIAALIADKKIRELSPGGHLISASYPAPQ